MERFPDVPGADKLLQWFDGAPSFHDAEVLQLHLDRSNTSWIQLMTTYKQAVVTFRWEEVADLELAEFSCQNVISGLTLERKDKVFRLTLSPCYGIAGFIEAERIEIEILPVS